MAWASSHLRENAGLFEMRDRLAGSLIRNAYGLGPCAESGKWPRRGWETTRGAESAAERRYFSSQRFFLHLRPFLHSLLLQQVSPFLPLSPRLYSHLPLSQIRP